MALKTNFYPVILAGGAGTRFWPRSRKRAAKQVLALDGDRTMIQQTVERLAPLAPAKRFLVITNQELQHVISQQLGSMAREHIIAEPVARNTAPAVGLAAFLLLRHDPDGILGIFPADHVISEGKRFRKAVEQAVKIAAAGDNIVVMGIKPSRPETGYGYIEVGEKAGGGAHRVRRFTEKPNLQRAEQFLHSGNYLWNSGMFVWSARTLANAISEHLPESAPYLDEIARSFGTSKFESTFAKLYPKCENISIDFAVLEPRSAKGEHRSNIYCIPAAFGWNDLGSWAALYEHSVAQKRDDGAARNVFEAAAGHLAMDAKGNYVHAPGKFVATLGVDDLVVVETPDALLITTRDRSQDVGKLVKILNEKKQTRLL